ncbi:MAG: hypothetical protein V4492_02560 [Chlamydiota bacterium]
MMKSSASCKMEVGKDEEGKEILLKDGKFQVMMEWEKPYMQACIDALKPFGSVLEIGFGLGYSATHIQSYNPSSHTIVEYHPDIAHLARSWASSHPGATIVEDTWQNALSQLGVFDCIFFDDYPLYDEGQMREMEQQTERSSHLLKQGESLVQEVHAALPFLREIQYTDENLEELFRGAPLQTKAQSLHLAQFLSELKANGQITGIQSEKCTERLMEGKLIDKRDIAEHVKREEKVCRPDDRLFIFLKQCLSKHMRNGSRFSCFLSSPASKFDDDKFFEEVIANPFLDYQEERIHIDVPSHCDYYHGTEALVITITKRCEGDVF